jgi:hypothetical protein
MNVDATMPQPERLHAATPGGGPGHASFVAATPLPDATGDAEDETGGPGPAAGAAAGAAAEEEAPAAMIPVPLAQWTPTQIAALSPEAQVAYFNTLSANMDRWAEILPPVPATCRLLRLLPDAGRPLPVRSR